MHKKKGLTKEQAIAKFWRARGGEIEKLIGVKRNKPDSRRMAISKGARESKQVKSRRFVKLVTSGKIVPTGIAQAMRGQHYRIEADRNEAILIRDAVQRIYLGK